MRNHIADRIAARRLHQAPRQERAAAASEEIARQMAFKEWEVFHSRCHLAVGGAIRALDNFLKQVDSAWTRRKMVEHNDPDRDLDRSKEMIGYAVDVLDSALNEMEKVEGLSAMGTVIGKFESSVLRADKKAYGTEL